MKKIYLFMLMLITIIVSTGCRQEKQELVVYFVPSREASEILKATDPLRNMLKTELNNRGFDFDNVNIQVGASYEAVSEALSAGTADVGFIPGGTYAAMGEDEAKVILTATRYGLTKDFETPKDWNDAQPTLDDTGKLVNYYRSLIIAGPSLGGRTVANKVNNNLALTWDDIKNLNWCVASSTSSAGYIYPTLWLNKNFQKSIRDLTTAVQTTGYGDAMTKLAGEQCDIATIYADARMTYAPKWTTEFNRTKPIWEETNVIGVTDKIYNDTISVTANIKRVSDDLITALQESMIAIAATDEGQEIIKIYNHKGYIIAKSSDYDNEREAQRLIKSLAR